MLLENILHIHDFLGPDSTEGGNLNGVIIPSGISIIVILAVAVTIGCCIFVIGLIIIKRLQSILIPYNMTHFIVLLRTNIDLTKCP